MKAIYWRGLDFYDPEMKHKVLIVGAGHVGSFIAYGLARMGVSDITVVDPDVVEGHNLPHQFISEKLVSEIDDGKISKATAVATTVEQMTGVAIDILIGKVQEFPELRNISFDAIFVCPDNMEARKYVFDNLRANLLIDIRTGGQFANLYAITVNQTDYYREHLYNDEDAVDLPCTGQAIIDVSMAISALAINRFRLGMAGKLQLYHTFHDFSTGLSWIMYGRNFSDNINDPVDIVYESETESEEEDDNDANPN